MPTLIRNGTTVIGQTVAQQDLLIQGETIAALGDLSHLREGDMQRVIDASGLLVLPGGVDTHVHFNDVFMNTVSVHDYHTGTVAAAYGGTTSVIDFSNQMPGQPLPDTIRTKWDEAAGKAIIDYGVHPVITQSPAHSFDETLAQIPVVVEMGSPTIKCYMTYRDEGLLMEEPELRRVLAGLRDAGGMMLVHAEDNDLAEAGIAAMLDSGRHAPIFHAESKPPEVENAAMRRCIRLVRETGGRLFIVHMTTAEGVAMVAQARADGLPVIAETCTHYLVFTVDALDRGEESLKWICSPPLRAQPHQDALWTGLADGRISQVTSDDAAYSWAATLMGRGRFDLCPNGMPGIEPRFQLLYSEGVAAGRISLPRFVELIATNPARTFGMAGKGELLPGFDADIVLLDPAATWTMGQAASHSPNDWHAYEGRQITGQIRQVFSRGELIIDGNNCLAQPGRGRYLHRTLPAAPTI